MSHPSSADADASQILSTRLPLPTLIQQLAKIYDNALSFTPERIDLTKLNIRDFQVTQFAITNENIDIDWIWDKATFKKTGRYIVSPNLTIREYDYSKRYEKLGVNVSVVKYPDGLDLSNQENPINVHLICKTLLASLITIRHVNCSILSVMNIAVKGSDLQQYDVLNQKQKNQDEIDPEGIYSIEITEHFFAMTKFESWLKKNTDKIDHVLLSKILRIAVEGLYQANDLFPGFVYGLFVPSCLLLVEKKNGRMELRMHKYYASSISTFVENNGLAKKVVEIRKACKAGYYDFYSFSNYLYSRFSDIINANDGLRKFFDLFLPVTIRSEQEYLRMGLYSELSDQERNRLHIKNIFGHLHNVRDAGGSDNDSNGDTNESRSVREAGLDPRDPGNESIKFKPSASVKLTTVPEPAPAKKPSKKSEVKKIKKEKKEKKKDASSLFDSDDDEDQFTGSKYAPWDATEVSKYVSPPVSPQRSRSRPNQQYFRDIFLLQDQKFPVQPIQQDRTIVTQTSVDLQQSQEQTQAVETSPTSRPYPHRQHPDSIANQQSARDAAMDVDYQDAMRVIDGMPDAIDAVGGDPDSDSDAKKDKPGKHKQGLGSNEFKVKPKHVSFSGDEGYKGKKNNKFTSPPPLKDLTEPRKKETNPLADSTYFAKMAPISPFAVLNPIGYGANKAGPNKVVIVQDQASAAFGKQLQVQQQQGEIVKQIIVDAPTNNSAIITEIKTVRDQLDTATTGKNNQKSVPIINILDQSKLVEKRPNFASLDNRIILGDLLTENIGTDVNYLDLQDPLKSTKIDSTRTNLLSFVKPDEIKDVNEYNFSYHPKKIDDFIILPCQTPIRYDPEKKQVVIVKNAFGVNARMYSLSYAQFDAYLHKNDGKYMYQNYACFRDLEYYSLIDQDVLVRKLCPNFVMEYSYYFVEFALDQAKDIELLGFGASTLTRPELSWWQSITGFVKDAAVAGKNAIVSKVTSLIKGRVLPEDIKPALKEYSGRMLLILTEAPSMSLKQWSTGTSKKTARGYELTSTGYHPDKVWYSVIFQTWIPLMILAQMGLLIRDMDIRNVFVKLLGMERDSDVPVTTGQGPQQQVVNYRPVPTKTSQFWEYQVNGISYYCLNEGVLILLDSLFQDDKDLKSLQQWQAGYGFKIVSNSAFFHRENDSSKASKKASASAVPNRQIYRGILENFIKIFDDMRSKSSGIKGSDITKFLDLLHSDLTVVMNKALYADEWQFKNAILQIFEARFGYYTNNRVGTLLKVGEIHNLRRNQNSNPGDTVFARGELVAEELGNDKYVWVMYLEPDPSKPGAVVVLTRGFADSSVQDRWKQPLQRRVTDLDLLYRYSQTEDVMQNNIGGVVYSMDNRIEEYKFWLD